MTATLKRIFFSTRLTAILFLTFGTAMALGTFIEKWHGTETARIWIYNAWWFEAIMLFFVINFTGNMFRYRLFRKEKLAVLLLHLSFILILIGAFVTRYISYEGMMPIREGETSNFFLSEETYLTVLVDGDLNGELRRKTLQDEVMITSKAAAMNLPWASDFNGKPFTIAYAGFIQGAEEGLIPDENGAPYLKIVESGGGTRHDHYLKDGEIASIHNILFALNKPTPGAINISINDTLSTIASPFEGTFMRMADQFTGKLAKDSIQPLMMRSLYNAAGMQFVFPDPLVNGRFDVVEAENKANAQDALVLDVTANNETRRVKLLGGKGRLNNPKKITLGDLDFYLSYGAMRRELPFSITLHDFIAEKYPGTEQGYASFMSKIRVNDTDTFDYDIYMNHVLDHKGFRFFQASFDPDEKGTILSVNHDFWGTWITYIGYFLLYAGLMGIMFFGKTRFKDLSQMLKKVKAKKAKLTTILLLLVTFSSFSQASQENSAENTTRVQDTILPEEKSEKQEDAHAHNTLPTKDEVEAAIKSTSVAKEHASEFGSLVIQDDGGRMKPLNTFASELLRKMSKHDTYAGLDANQVFLSMVQQPGLWYNVEFFYLKRGNDSLRRLIGIPEGKKYAKAIDFFDAEGGYKLAPYLREAYATNTPNQFQKDFKSADQRLGLLNRALSGEILKIFPLPDDENNKWVAYPELSSSNFTGTDSLYVKNILPLYVQALKSAKTSGDYKNASQLLESVKGFQKKYGAEVIPSEKRVNAEILYNKYDIFKTLFSWFMYAGTVMFILIIIQIFRENKAVKISVKTLKYIIFGLFALHTLGLISRWYISGHAPWSDAYESMIYVAWATMGIGLLFARKSDLTVAATAFVTSIILMIAHWSWMDPSIANLQPVLNSYWLMIHVAVIVASYGPFTLGMILGIVSMLLMLLTNKKNKAKMDLNIKELTIINELALTVGLVMLTIGNFLGGQWANESWGRYWGWDPKETWALISIMVYAFVIHMRLVPGLRGRWLFNLMSVFAFASIMMTYFGVNFYLTGLHSYASGDKIITPDFVYYSVISVVVLGALSYWRYNVHYKK